MKKTFYILLAAFIALPWGSCSKAREASVAFTGDIMMHIPVKACAESHDLGGNDTIRSLNNRGFDFLFRRIRDSLMRSDIVVGNMEFPVAPPYTGKPKIFNCRPEVVPAMKKAGFTMLTIANNHVLDQGERGIRTTLDLLRENKFDTIGVGYDEPSTRAGIVKEVNGIRIGFLGYTGYLNYWLPKKMVGYHLNWFYNRNELMQDIAAMRKRCDYLVMVVHTGVEYVPGPRVTDVELFRKCIDTGVDLIIAHHPHMIQPIEKYVAPDGRPCYMFYSLGNFISNQEARSRYMSNGVPITLRDSFIARCILTGTGRGKRPEARFEIMPIKTINIMEDNKRVIQTVSLSDEIKKLKKKLPGSSGKEKVDMEQELQNLYQKSTAVRMFLLRKEIKEITFN